MKAAHLALPLLVFACGARTGLPAADLGLADAAAAPADAAADVAPPPCAGTGTAGSVAWRLAMDAGPATDAGAMTFTGPWAADTAGATYYLGTAGQYPSTYSVIAVDACGHQAWRTDGTAYGLGSQEVRPTLLLAGDAVVVQIGAVDAFDRRTGVHLWNVSLDALAGEKLAGDDLAEIGPSAAAEDGTVYAAFETGAELTIAAITPAGAPSIVAKTPNEGDLISFILDAAGHLDVLFNSALKGSYVESFTRSGAPVFAAAFQCQITSLGPMASASRFILMQTGACVLSLTGTSAFAFSPAPDFGDFDAVVVGAQDELYASESTAGVVSYDAAGHRRWTTKLPRYPVAGPALSQGGDVVLLEADLATRPIGSVTVVALDAASGATRWTRDLATGGDVATLGYTPLLVTSARQVVVGVGGNEVVALVVGTAINPAAAWPTPGGGADSRNAARGQ